MKVCHSGIKRMRKPCILHQKALEVILHTGNETAFLKRLRQIKRFKVVTPKIETIHKQQCTNMCIGRISKHIKHER